MHPTMRIAAGWHCPRPREVFGACRGFCDPLGMRLGFWCGALVLAGCVAGCLTTNPALTDSSGNATQASSTLLIDNTLPTIDLDDSTTGNDYTRLQRDDQGDVQA